MYKKTALSLMMASLFSTAVAANAPAELKPILEKDGSSEEVNRNIVLKKAWVEARGAESNSGFDNSTPTTATGRDWTGPVTKDRVLAILIDFPDYPVNAVTADLTQNYYDDYSVEHYERMLFSTTGYPGPQGQNLISMNQYFIDQSGGSYEVEGKVAGWYTAENNAAYYGAPNGNGGRDSRVHDLIMEAINHAANDPSIDLSYFDQEDRYDYDNDGDLREPDGVIDHVMVYHSSIDEAAQGGALQENAIWSHRHSVGFRPVGDSGYFIHDYTVQPVDGAAGVSAHEYGHDLGLPDEYDTRYTKDGEGRIFEAPGSTVGFWSSMSGGSYAGEISGTAPTGMSPFAKQFLQHSLGGNWFVGTNIHEDELTHGGQIYKLDAASVRGDNNDYIRIDLDDKSVVELESADGLGFITPAKGDSSLAQYGLNFSVDLTEQADAALKFTVDYDSDNRNSLGQVRVTTADGATYVVDGNITNMNNRFSQFIGAGFAGNSNGKQAAEFDLSAFVGQEISVSIQYWGFDTGFIGMMFDDITVEANNTTLVSYDADNANNPGLIVDGFTAGDGVVEYPHYYLVEWRQHMGVDESLKSVTFMDISYDPGMLIWYVDTSYRPEKGGISLQQGDNHVGEHPGEGWIGVVDADRNPILFNTGEMLSSEYQIKDAAFSLDVQKPFEWSTSWGLSTSDLFINNNPQFADWDDYTNYLRPATGRKLPHKGIIINVLEQSDDKSVASIRISKIWP